MFYSQFILAKKGPLGTIWVAAHLERKLRKNQVADTDIGDSVDSILCPEVPIALRLSSHLLLGVVRIYSRKVNYLFDDCSETLLKVKQAFRTTDVDLPPEEITAPYNSITLPETFDLDDFELPDNEIFQGNHTDHHTSTRDQITLQDMDGVVYSTSHFGLDDTFGDGETSSLNLDEGLVLQKDDGAGDAATSADHQLSAHSASPKQDEGCSEMPANQESRIENVDLEGDIMDYAQAPSTPGLVETPNIGNVQEISTCEDHMDDDEDQPLVVSVANENSETISEKANHREEENAQQPGHKSAIVDLPCEDNGNDLIDLNVEKRFDSSDFGAQNISTNDPTEASRTSFAVADEPQALGQEPNSTKMAILVSTGGDRTQDLENANLEIDGGVNGPSVSVKDHGECSGIISNESAQDASFSNSCLQLPVGVSYGNQISPYEGKSKDMDVSGNLNRPICTNSNLDLNFEHRDLSSIEKPEDVRAFNGAVFDEMPRTQLHDVGAIPREFPGGGQWSHVSGPTVVVQDNPLKHNLNVNHTTGRGLINDIHAGFDKSYNQTNNVVDNALKHNLNENHTTGRGLINNDIHAGFGKSYNQTNNVVGGGEGMLKNVSSSLGAIASAPEKQWSLQGGHYNQPRELPEDTRVFNRAVSDEMPRTQLHIHSPYRTGLELADSSHDMASGGGERIHASGPPVVVQDYALEHNLNKYQTAGPGLIKDIHAAYGKSYNQVNNVVGGDGMLNNVSGSLSKGFSAPEKLMSVPDVYNNQPRDLPEDNRMFNGAAVFDETTRTQLHTLRPCRTGLELADSSNDLAAPDYGAIPWGFPGSGERIHVSRPAVVVQDDALKHNLNENHNAGGSGLIKDFHGGSSKSYNQVNNVVGGDNMLKYVSNSFGAMYSAPEKQLSVPDMHNYQPRGDLPVDTRVFNRGAVFDEMPRTQTHVLRPSRTGSEVAESSYDMARGGGERIHATSGPPVPVQGPGSGNTYNQVNYVVGGDSSTMRNVSGPLGAMFSPPEKLLSVVPDVLNNQPRHLPVEATPRDVSCLYENDANSWKKRSYTEINMTEQQSMNSVKSARVVRDKRSGEASPNDDYLSSILDGRGSSILKVESTPPPLPPREMPPVKRRGRPPRANALQQASAPRASAYKRKAVLMDDMLVMHGDIIRQQLINTADIRRLRRKAQSTRPETSIILKQSLEDEIFSEPLCSGMSIMVTSLFNHSYNINRIKVITKDDVSGASALSLSEKKFISGNESIRNLPSSVPAAIVENDTQDCVPAVKENADMYLNETGNKLDADNELSVGPNITDLEFNSTENKEENEGPVTTLPSLHQNIVENEIGSINVPSEVVDFAPMSSSSYKEIGTEASVKMKTDEVVSSDNDVRGSKNVMSEDSLIINESIRDVNDVRFDTTNSCDNTVIIVNEVDSNERENTQCADDTVETERLYSEQAQHDDPCGPTTEIIKNDVNIRNYNEPLPAVTSAGSPAVTSAGSPAVTSAGSPAVTLYPPGFGTSGGSSVVTSLCPPGFGTSGESPVVTSLCPPGFGSSGGLPAVTSLYPPGYGNTEDSVLDGSKCPIEEEEDVNPMDAVDEESSDPDVQDYDDINSPDDVDMNSPDDVDDTGFLNDDDELVTEEADEDVPNADATRFVDNSGWSSRTRAVANYLQTVFMREAEYDKKVVPIDNLLVGKTRKEACRMFFETLVLKTKDYIQVEQEGPFQNINVKPKMKLLKSDF